MSWHGGSEDRHSQCPKISAPSRSDRRPPGRGEEPEERREAIFKLLIQPKPKAATWSEPSVKSHRTNSPYWISPSTLVSACKAWSRAPPSSCTSISNWSIRSSVHEIGSRASSTRPSSCYRLDHDSIMTPDGDLARLASTRGPWTVLPLDHSISVPMQSHERLCRHRPGPRP